MLHLYEYKPSGNCYKVRLLLTQLEIPFQRSFVDILNKESRTPEFLTKNPNGRIPLLELEPGKFLAESNAMLYYLSADTPFFPTDAWERAQVMQWLFFEQYSHEPYIATIRFWISYLHKTQEFAAEIAKRREQGYAALAVMEQHLMKHDYFVGGRYTIADIGLFAYTHVAGEGDFDLARFPHILQWIDRIKSQPNYISILE